MYPDFKLHTHPTVPVQVLSCPNPDSCSYASRQQALQQLQVDVRNAYYAHQRSQALSTELSADTVTASNVQRHRSLASQEQIRSQSTSQDGTRGTSFPTVSSITPGSLVGAYFSRMRSILAAPAASLPPLLPPPPPSPFPSTLPPTTSQPSSALFVHGFFTAAAVNLSTYADAQCAPGYTGRLCASCVHGYGSQGVATCKLCPSRSLNTLYYILATLLTLVLLAWTFQSAFSDVRSLKLELAEARKREEEEERAAEEEEHALGTFRPSPNTMQGPSSRSLQVGLGTAGLWVCSICSRRNTGHNLPSYEIEYDDVVLANLFCSRYASHQGCLIRSSMTVFTLPVHRFLLCRDDISVLGIKSL